MKPLSDTVAAHAPNVSGLFPTASATLKSLEASPTHLSQLVLSRCDATSSVDNGIQPVLRDLLRIDEPVTEHDAAFLDRYGFLSPSTPVMQAEVFEHVSATSTRQNFSRTPPRRLPVPFDQCAPPSRPEQRPRPDAKRAVVARPQRTLHRKAHDPLNRSSRPRLNSDIYLGNEDANASDVTPASHQDGERFGDSESSSGARGQGVHQSVQDAVGKSPRERAHSSTTTPSYWDEERGAVYPTPSVRAPTQGGVIGSVSPRYAAPSTLEPPEALLQQSQTLYGALSLKDFSRSYRDAEQKVLEDPYTALYDIDEYSWDTSPSSCPSDISCDTQSCDFTSPTDEYAPGIEAYARPAASFSFPPTPTHDCFGPAPMNAFSLVEPSLALRGQVGDSTYISRSSSFSELPHPSSDSPVYSEPADVEEGWSEEPTSFLFLPRYTEESSSVFMLSPLQVDLRDRDSVPVSRYSALDGALTMH
ncbi:hypothetical protein C8Q79DRAFT_1013628 [Trametes meyenii]|nr:hypothetical protein C8Q79DRAFT_1013628 [Trametes meyenii]